MKSILLILSVLLTFTLSANVIVVQNTNDAGPGSLREITSLANPDDTIRFNPSIISTGSKTIELDSAISPQKGLTIIGMYNTTDTLFISGKNNNRIFVFNGVNTVSLDSLVLINGFTTGSGGGLYFYALNVTLKNSIIRNCTSNFGGGLYVNNISNARILVQNCIITGNNATNYGGGIFISSPKSSLTITNSTFSNNSAGYYAGGVFCRSTNQDNIISVRNSTFYNNSANYGGGVYSIASSSSNYVTCTNSTFYDNTATYGGGIYAYANSGNKNLVTLTSCIFSKNGSRNIYNNHSTTIVSKGYNIFNNAIINGSISSDQLGVTISQLNLGPLQNNGGFSRTLLPQYPSVAINLGNPLDLTDAQNIPIVSRRDVGSAENCIIETIDSVDVCDEYKWTKGDGNTYQNDTTVYFRKTQVSGCDSMLILILNINLNTTEVVTNTNDAGPGSLRQLVADACPGDTIRFDPSLIAGGSDTITVLSEISFNKNLTFKGLYNSSDTLFISGNNTNRILNSDLSSSTVKELHIDSMVFINGNANNNQGGAVLVRNGDTLTVFNSLFRNNRAINGGGGLASMSTPFYVFNCTFFSNSSTGGGGGIYAHTSSLTVENSTIHQNYAQNNGGGVHSYSYSSSNLLNIINSTITNNSANKFGGAVYNYVHSSSYSSTTTIVNSTISNNTALLYGDGIYSSATVSNINVKSSIVAFNGVENFNSNFSNSINSQGFNIFSDSYLNGNISSDQLGIDSTQLNLGPLKINGGTTKTMLPLFPSVAIDMGDSTNSNNAQNINIIGIREVGAAENNLTFSAVTNVSICDNYTWHSGDGNTYYQDTLVYYKKSKTDGENIYTLDLDILNSYSTDVQIHCDSFTWTNGNTYYMSNNTALDTFTNRHGCDSVVLLNLTLNKTTYSTDIQVQCDSFTWINGITYLTSNTSDKDTLVNVLGCDSIVTLHLTINHSNFSTDVQNHCNSYTWINGVTYTSSNVTAKDTLTNAAGCDSIVSLNLIIRNKTYATETIVACNSFTWRNGVTYTASNSTAKDTIFNSQGCDSIISLDLTINNSTNSIDVQNHCDSYTWIDGNTYFTNNSTATKIFTNSKGCDSIVTLNLTISNSTNSVDVQLHCDSYTWINGITYTSSTNTVKDTIVGGNSQGCDSIISLFLIIKNSTTSIDTQVHCDSYTWRNGVTYTASNSTAKDTIFNSQGCDSIISLNLTILKKSFYTDVQSHCVSYTWMDGNTYFASNHSSTYTLKNSVGCDSIITLNLTIRNKTYATDVQTHCDSYTWTNGVTYTESNNTALDTFVNAAGCDSIVTLNLTINKTTRFTHSIVACDSFTWIDGNTYTSDNNSAIDTLVNASGCDSIVTLDLTINKTTRYTHSIVACSSYTWIDGKTYTSSNNVATHTLVNSNGCDSVLTLDLLINNPTASIDVQKHCDSFTWKNGVTYTSSNNTDTIILTNSKGCDSIITLDLTIIKSNTGISTITACDTYTWINGVTYTASNNTATHTLTNIYGCDSVVTLNLTINKSNTGVDLVTACDSYTWINGVTYTASTTSPSYTLTNTMGCDSVVTLNLTINNSTSGVDVQSACGSYTWIDGNTYTRSTNSATWTLIGANYLGCDSVITLNLTINPTTTTNRTIYECFSYTVPETNNIYTVSGVYKDSILNSSGCYDFINTTLTINTVSAGTIQLDTSGLTVSTSGQNYRWLNCDNGYSVINGATSQTYLPTQNGKYACMVYTNSGCVDTSACFDMNTVGVSEIKNEFSFNLYPNPASDVVTLSFENNQSNSNIKIFNVFGKLIYENRVEDNESNFVLDVSKFANGTYTVVVYNDWGIKTRKVVVNR